MNVEQKDNEMVQRARELHESGNVLTKLQMEIICPELRENEDDRIRKEIIEFIQWAEDRGKTRQDFHQAKRPREWIAYLEKQKEQKPEWREEDEYIINTLIHHYELINPTSSYFDKVPKERFLAWLKSLRPSWKPSEEQLVTLKRISGLLKDWGLSKEAKAILMLEGQLANLPMPEKLTESHWKPSEKKVKPPKNVPPIESIMI